MKLCPQCHFTFDDWEQVCDFDGSNLTPCDDPAPLADRIAPVSKKSRHVPFAELRGPLAGLTGVLLLSGLSLIVRYKSSSPPKVDEPPVIAERQHAIVSTAPTRKHRRRIAYAHKPAHHVRTALARASTPRRTSTPTRITTSARSLPADSRRISTPALTTTSARPLPADFGKQTVALSEKKDSKVTTVFKKTGSALKKTLSILKKPFEL